MWWTALACSPAPKPPAVTDARAWAGGDGVTIALTGHVEGTAHVPGMSAADLAAAVGSLERDPCPGDAVRWRRTRRGSREEGPPNVTACALRPPLAVGGRDVDELSLDLGDGSLWIDVWLPDETHLRAEAPFDRKVGIAGSQRASLSWECRTCDPHAVVGEGEAQLDWAFDRAVQRDWSWERKVNPR